MLINHPRNALPIASGIIGLGITLLFGGCFHAKPERPPVIATIGMAGSLDGAYGIVKMQIRDTRGGGAGFGYGAVNGYGGKSATIGIGIPKSIEGEWAKLNNGYNSGFATFYRISTPIDAELAKQKVATFQHYYQHFHATYGVMEVVVKGPRVMVMLNLGCYAHRMDCRPREHADPNGWVVKAPESSADVVVLFDGVGESSTTPFPGSILEKRLENKKKMAAYHEKVRQINEHMRQQNIEKRQKELAENP